MLDPRHRPGFERLIRRALYLWLIDVDAVQDGCIAGQQAGLVAVVLGQRRRHASIWVCWQALNTVCNVYRWRGERDVVDF